VNGCIAALSKSCALRRAADVAQLKTMVHLGIMQLLSGRITSASRLRLHSFGTPLVVLNTRRLQIRRSASGLPLTPLCPVRVKYDPSNPKDPVMDAKAFLEDLRCYHIARISS
jgi:hypothetical protein